MRPRLAGPIGLLFLFLLVPKAEASVTTARCEFNAVDAYGMPASGIEVTLSMLMASSPDDPSMAPELDATEFTGANGHASLSLTAPAGSYRKAICYTNSAAGGYSAYGGEQSLLTFTNNATLVGSLVVVPKPIYTFPLALGGTADLYQKDAYDKPIVVAQPFNSAEPLTGRMSAADLWTQYNGNPSLLSGGMLARLYSQGFDVWLVRPHLVGDDLTRQAADFAQAVQEASAYSSYNSAVSVAGYSLGGLVVRIAMSQWRSYGFGPAPPVNLIATLDSPLRGALVSNDLQHAFWNASFDDGKSAHDHNMDSCAAQQMLENACHKTVNCTDCLECNDEGWYETFFGGNSFSYCNHYQGACALGALGVKTCSGIGMLTQQNGGWPMGIKKIAASLGKFGERTGVCYGDASGLDTTGNGTDGCPGVDAATFDVYNDSFIVGFGTKWGYLDIALSTDRDFYYRRIANVSSSPTRQHMIDELTPGSRQPGTRRRR